MHYQIDGWQKHRHTERESKCRSSRWALDALSVNKSKVRIPSPHDKRGKTMKVYHFSEESEIERFVPHPAPRSDIGKNVVWAIDEARSYKFHVPRDCPRVTGWADQGTTDEDIENILGGNRDKILYGIEGDWLERCFSTILYRYEFELGNFYEFVKREGVYVSEKTETPSSVD